MKKSVNRNFFVLIFVIVLLAGLVSAGLWEWFTSSGGNDDEVLLSPPTNGLVAYYPLAGTFNDMSGNGQNGVPAGNVWFTDDSQKGRVANFNGISSYVKVFAIDSIKSSSFTISFFMKSDLRYNAETSQPAFLFYDGVSSGTDVYFYQHSSANTAFTMLTPTNAVAASKQITYEPNQWQHITGVYDKTNSQLKLYSNGNLVDTKTGIGDVNNYGDLYLGKSPYGNFFNGALSEVRIYNRVLSQSEINELAGIVSGGGTELCNGVDDDSDGIVDEGCATSCTPNWQCTLWSSCSNGQQARTCTDSKSCGTSAGKPLVTQSCVSEEDACLTGETFTCPSGYTIVQSSNLNTAGSYYTGTSCSGTEYTVTTPYRSDARKVCVKTTAVNGIQYKSAGQVYGTTNCAAITDTGNNFKQVVEGSCVSNYVLTCTNIDFNCDNKVNDLDKKVFSDFYISTLGTGLTQAFVDAEKTKCINFGNYLQVKLNSPVGGLSLGDTNEVENKINSCFTEREPPCGSYGDVDSDGDVDGNDATLVLTTQDSSQKLRADVDGDGDADDWDSLIIIDYISGSISTFPVCSSVCPSGKVLGCPEGFSEITSSSDGGNSNVGSYYTGASCSETEYAKTPYRSESTKLCISINTATPSCRSGRIGANCNSLSVCNIVGLREVKEKECVEVGCTPGEKMCQGSHYLLCNSNGVFEDKGNVDGYCGVVFHCEDSDGGLSYFVKGETKSSVSIEISDGGGAGGGSTAIDSCLGNVLTEYICNQDNTLGSRQFTCPHGCSDGACLPPPGRGGRAVCLREQAGGNIEVDPRVRVEITPVGLNYCDPRTLDFKPVEPNGAVCLNDYECRSNACIDGECVSLKLELERQTNLLNKIWCWIKDVFGGEDYNICIARSGGSCVPNWQVGNWNLVDEDGVGCGVRTVTDTNQCGVVCSSVEDVEDCLTLKLCGGLSGED